MVHYTDYTHSNCPYGTAKSNKEHQGTAKFGWDHTHGHGGGVALVCTAIDSV